MKKFYIIALCVVLWGCHRHKSEGVQIPDSPEPDRVLFEHATKDLSKQRFTVARLTLQTLINTYPDSEYLPQAKFALAKSFYQEGTGSSYTQAEAEFRDFITFFPTSDQADDAQYMIAMTHVKQIEQPDRDSTQAQLAEVELKRFMDNYPDSPRLPEVKERLRGVEEVLAEGVFDVGNEYYQRHSWPAAVDRYREVLQKYQDFSEADQAIYFMAESMRHLNQAPQSAILYGEILVDHPLSVYSLQAKQRLKEMSLPIPDPNPVALARAQQLKPEVSRGLLGHMWELMKPRPDVSADTLPAADDLPPGPAIPSKKQTDSPATSPAIPGTNSNDPKVPAATIKPPASDRR